MTRLEALEMVAKAARYEARRSGVSGPVAEALAALDDLPAPAAEPVGEVVEPLRAVSVAISQADGSGPWTRHVVMNDGSMWDQSGGEWVRVPLPRVHEVVGEGV